MTETEWGAATDPAFMLESVKGKTSDRKLRLYAVACGRLVSHGWYYSEAEAAFYLSEMYADCRVDGDALRTGREQAIADANQVLADWDRGKRDTIWAAIHSAENSIEIAPDYTIGYVRAILGPIPDWMLCRFADDIFGNPFRPVAVDPDWLTSTVVALARGIYDDRAFDRMPILADALQDAGCDNDDVLTHCRGDGPHVRGCWVVDLLLGKS